MKEEQEKMTEKVATMSFPVNQVKVTGTTLNEPTMREIVATNIVTGCLIVDRLHCRQYSN